MAVAGLDRAVEIVPGRLYALGGTFPLDGRESWAPRHVRGFQSNNQYVILEGKHLFMVDTGLAALLPRIEAQLRDMLKPDMSLSIFLTRAEFDGNGNIQELAKRFPIADTDGWDFGLPFASRPPAVAPTKMLITGGSRELAPGRVLTTLPPAMFFLATYWLYDAATKTLFTSDTFSHGYSATPDDRVQEDPALTPTPAEIRERLAPKYWWIARSHPGQIARQLAKTFTERDVEIIAPTLGRTIKGRAAVRANVRALLDALPGGTEVAF